MKKRILSNCLPMHLQFFADEVEGEEPTPPEEKETGEEGSPEEKSKTYEDALAEIAAAQAEAKKAKADRDAALKKSGELTKQLRAKMTEAELEAEKKQADDEERQAHIKELETYKAQNEALKRYRLQGMSDELAEKAAKAEIDGDMDELASIQQQHTKALLKETEESLKQKFLKDRPRVNMGDGEDSSMTREEIFAIKDPVKRQAAIARNLKQFE